MLACRVGHITVAELLIANGADIEAKDDVSMDVEISGNFNTLVGRLNINLPDVGWSKRFRQSPFPS
jgi:ankyrin repeat protein